MNRRVLIGDSISVLDHTSWRLETHVTSPQSNLLRIICGTICFLCLLVCSLQSQATDWRDLSTQEQQVLNPYKDKWDALPEQRQEAIRKGVARWLSMDDRQRADFGSRLEKWKQLTPAQQELARKRFQAFSNLPPDLQQKLREKHQWFSKQSPDKRDALKKQWRSMNPTQRREMIRQRIERRNDSSRMGQSPSNQSTMTRRRVQ